VKNYLKHELEDKNRRLKLTIMNNRSWYHS
jgi:hypothetical protein